MNKAEKIELYSAVPFSTYSDDAFLVLYLDFVRQAMAILEPHFSPPLNLFDEKKESEPYNFDRRILRYGDQQSGISATIQVDEIEARSVSFSRESLKIQPYGQSAKNSVLLNLVREPNHTWEECTLSCEITAAQKQDAQKIIASFQANFPVELSDAKIKKLGEALPAKLARGQFESAGRAAEKVLEKDAENAHALFALGLRSALEKNYPQAEMYLKHTIRVMPDHYDAFYNLGVVLIRQEKYAEAEQALRSGLKLDEHNHPMYYELAVALENQGKTDEAIANYKRAVEESPNPGGTFGYSGMDFTDKAEAALTRLKNLRS